MEFSTKNIDSAQLDFVGERTDYIYSTYVYLHTIYARGVELRPCH